MSSHNGSNQQDESISSVDTCFKVVTGSPVQLLLLDVFLDAALVKEPVLSHGLGKLSGLGEYFSPGSNRGEVFLKSCTLAEVK